MDETCTPPPAFSFSVALAGPGSVEPDGAFQEASGVDPHVQVEAVGDGGANRYVHQLPGVSKHSNLVLKRGYVRQASALAEWAGQTVGSTLGAPIQTQTVIVTLLGPAGAALVSWTFANAWPVKWEVGALDSNKEDLLTETLEIAYTTVNRTVA